MTPTKKKIDYRQPHKFESDGTMNDLGKPLCVCGLPYDIQKLHGQIPKKKKKKIEKKCPCRYEGEEKCCHEDCKICNPTPEPTKKKIECMEDCCVQRREFNFSNKVTPEPSGWEGEFDEKFLNMIISRADRAHLIGVKMFISTLLAKERKKYKNEKN